MTSVAIDLAAEMATARAEAAAALADKVLIALMAGPLWTTPTLVACGIDPAAFDGAGALVTTDGRGADRSWSIAADAVAVVRAEIERRDVRATTHLDGSTPQGRTRLFDALSKFGALLFDCAVLPPVLGHWRELVLAATASPTDAATQLVSDVRTACDAGTPGRVLDRLEAAAALARAIGGPISAAVRIGQHRVEYAYRVARDRRGLVGSVPRAGAVRAFERLLADDDAWALHILGVGGVGKSTLLRQLVLDERGVPRMPVARVDFDYLSAAYPARDPGRLIQLVVDELVLQLDRPGQDRMVSAIHEGLTIIRALAERERLTVEQWFHHGEFNHLLAQVADFVATFERSLLILDTCEELMKLAPQQGRVPSVEATFRLIEALHARAPGLRVVFAGRRLLAERGRGWRATANVDADGRQRLPLSGERPYLALYELRGFTRDEAITVARARLPAARVTDDGLCDALLAAAPEDERVGGFDAPDIEADAQCFSPFRVVALAEWVAGEPDLPIARLAESKAEGLDVYIEQRIAQRMGALAPLLPAISILRRFDRATLAAVTGRDAGEVGALVDDLAGHEWIDVADEDGRGAVLTAKPSVAVPLARYLASAQPIAWSQARARIAAALGPRLDEAGAVRLPPELIDAALRAMPAEAAALAWMRLERGIGDDWTTARALTGFLTSERGAAAAVDSLLGTAVRATRASALIHLEPAGDEDLIANWEEIEREASALVRRELPAEERASSGGDAPPAWLLLHRARLGLIAERAWRHDVPSAKVDEDFDLDDAFEEVDKLVQDLARWHRIEALITPVIAAIEAVIEAAERAGEPGPKIWLALASLPQLPGGLGAMHDLFLARHAALHDTAGAQRWIDAAWERAADDDLALPPTTLDWLPPASMRARVQLEIIRIGFYDHEPGVEPPWVQVPPRSTDRDWLHLSSALRLYREAHATIPPAPEDLANEPKERIDPLRPYAAHRRFPIAGGILAQVRDGRLPWDIDSERLGPISALVAASTRALFAVDPKPIAADRRGGRALLHNAIDQQAHSVVSMNDFIRVDDPDSPDAKWSYAIAATPDAREFLVLEFRASLDATLRAARSARPRISAPAAALIEEMVELSRFTDQAIATTPPALLPADAHVHPDDIEVVVRAALRAHALDKLVIPPAPDDKAAIAVLLRRFQQLAPRRFAQLAYDEAQLLALRLPARAIVLFDIAAAFTTDAMQCNAAKLGRLIAGRRAGFADRPTDVLVVARAIDDPVLGPIARVIRDAKAEAPPALLAPFELGERRAVPVTGKLAALWRAHGQDAAVWMGVGLVLLVTGVGGFFLLRWMTEWVEGLVAGTESFASTTGMIAVAVASIYLGVKAWGWIKFLVTLGAAANARRMRAAARITRRDELHARLELSATGAAPIAIAVDLPRAPASPVIRSDEIDRAALRPITAKLARLDAEHPAPLRLFIDEAIASRCWEASIPAIDARLEPVRVIERPAPVPQPRHAGHWFASIATTATFRNGIRGEGVVHAIGRPVRGLSTVTIDLGDEVAGRGPMSAAELNPAGTVLVILQGASQASSEVPTDSTRREVALLRELALLLIRQGAPSVLVIPATPELSMGHVLDAIQRRVPRAFTTARLIELARAARACLRAIDDDAHRAASYEVSMFITEPAGERT